MTDAQMRLQIATADPEEAHEWLRAAYTDHAVRLSGRRQAFRFSHRVADAGLFKVGIAHHSMTLRGEWSPLGDILLFSQLLGGRFAIRSAHGAVDAGPGDVFSYDPDVAKSVEWADIRMAQVRLQRPAVERVAAELAGADRGPGPVRFELARPVSTTAALHWTRLMQYLTRDVATNPAVHGSPLLLRQVFRLIVATALETFPNTTLHHDAHRPRPAAPGAVRRAVAYIEEHAGEDIDLTAVAEAAGVGPRALQRAFRGALETTPLARLRSVRLDRAHEELAAAGGGDTTVSAVAARWGFGHPGRFAAEYRARFGRTPSATLRG